jgi:hypothetical protein
MTAQHLKNAILDGTIELEHRTAFYTDCDGDGLKGETKCFVAGQKCTTLRLSQNRRALLVIITEERVKGQWIAPSDTAGGGGIFRHWYSWLHADL